MNKVFILLGQTCTGKTNVSIEIAQKLPIEIISADSRQVYKYMDIGTAKPTKEEMKAVPHYLIDIIYPDEEFNAFIFQTKALELIEDIIKRSKIPLIVGGTALYLKGLIEGYNFACGTKDRKIRNRLISIGLEKGFEHLYQRLTEIDPDYAKTISPTDKIRIVRALEVYEVSGLTFSQAAKNSENKYEYKVFGLSIERELLYERINKRVDLMIQNNLIDEVKFLIDKYDISTKAFQTYGYKEIIDYLVNNLPLNEAIELIKKNTRNFAKRQMTWFRKMNAEWIENIDYNISANHLIKKIKEELY
ncbi:tRNA dimethylallyltransferase [Thermodesulfobium narugense DSM 14796]|uniref:tRNA dimethylallyltransferase n=1 Tax=Thermodesulfobium narugense DSM 14796 TaxID=747365 RepID=M1E931_9BACT|nr:tRNA (adenosine(37)-N6)-dimethylallyltransferase MiaA [Thermodesulfobium narugense]AEE14819.1 tRNA dimethylallyltransferase [Thermodesulfobium narugense DSM 14796]